VEAFGGIMDAGSIFVTVSAMMLAHSTVLANNHSDLPEGLRPSAVCWQIATLLIATGCGLFAFGNALPVPVLVIPANCAFVVGLAFYGCALQRF